MVEHYFTKSPKGKLRYYLVKTDIRGFDLIFKTCSGIFSPKYIDKGTKLLAEKMIVFGDVLDFGCGYGVIGIVASKLGANVFMTDINERAVNVCKENIKINSIKAEVNQGNFYFFNKKFDCIISNPPITAGRKICFKIIEESYKNLKENGILEIVARHKKGGNILMEKMLEVFGNVKTIAKKGGYRVYLSKKL